MPDHFLRDSMIGGAVLCAVLVLQHVSAARAETRRPKPIEILLLCLAVGVIFFGPLLYIRLSRPGEFSDSGTTPSATQDP
jgi:hypothetical protein